MVRCSDGAATGWHQKWDPWQPRREGEGRSEVAAADNKDPRSGIEAGVSAAWEGSTKPWWVVSCTLMWRTEVGRLKSGLVRGGHRPRRDGAEHPIQHGPKAASTRNSSWRRPRAGSPTLLTASCTLRTRHPKTWEGSAGVLSVTWQHCYSVTSLAACLA